MSKGLLAVFIVAALLIASSAGVGAYDKKIDAKAQSKVGLKAQETVVLRKAIFLGPGIHCDLCAKTIEQAFVEAKGVECVHVDVKSKLATFCYFPEETNSKKIGQTLRKAGFKSDLVKVFEAECPCDKCGEFCKHWEKAKSLAEDCTSAKRKACPFAEQCKKVCK